VRTMPSGLGSTTRQACRVKPSSGKRRYVCSRVRPCFSMCCGVSLPRWDWQRGQTVSRRPFSATLIRRSVALRNSRPDPVSACSALGSRDAKSSTTARS
jgi:hypothetical protein